MSFLLTFQKTKRPSEEGFLCLLCFLALLGCHTSHYCYDLINLVLQKLISQGFYQSGMRPQRLLATWWKWHPCCCPVTPTAGFGSVPWWHHPLPASSPWDWGVQFQSLLVLGGHIYPAFPFTLSDEGVSNDFFTIFFYLQGSLPLNILILYLWGGTNDILQIGL